MPRRSRTERQQRAWQAAEEVGFGTCRGERKANAAGGLDDPGGGPYRRCAAGSSEAAFMASSAILLEMPQILATPLIPTARPADLEDTPSSKIHQKRPDFHVL